LPAFGTQGMGFEYGKGLESYDPGMPREEVYVYCPTFRTDTEPGNNSGTDVFVRVPVSYPYFYVHWTPRPLHKWWWTRPDEWVPMGFVRRNGVGTEDGVFERPDQYKIFGFEGIQMRAGAVEGVSSVPLEGKTNKALHQLNNEAHLQGPQYWGKSFSMIGGKANPVQVQVGGKGVGKGKDKQRDGKGPRS